MTLQQESWLQRERVSGRFCGQIAALILVFLIAMSFSVLILRRGGETGTLLLPPLIALLLVAILLQAIALMALYARRLAVQRAERGGLGSGRLHVRLVALFTAIAAVPTVLVAIFASLLFQSGLSFWFSAPGPRKYGRRSSGRLPLRTWPGRFAGNRNGGQHVGWPQPSSDRQSGSFGGDRDPDLSAVAQ